MPSSQPLIPGGKKLITKIKIVFSIILLIAFAGLVTAIVIQHRQNAAIKFKARELESRMNLLQLKKQINQSVSIETKEFKPKNPSNPGKKSVLMLFFGTPLPAKVLSKEATIDLGPEI